MEGADVATCKGEDLKDDPDAYKPVEDPRAPLAECAELPERVLLVDAGQPAQLLFEAS